jgi:hypothetical protein
MHTHTHSKTYLGCPVEVDAALAQEASCRCSIVPDKVLYDGTPCLAAACEGWFVVAVHLVACEEPI